MSIGSRIKERRNQLNLTQEDLAKKIGITKGAVANYENSVSIPKPDILYKVMEFLDCDANFLYQDDVSFSSVFLYPDEKEIIHQYRNLDEIGKKHIKYTIYHEFTRMSEIKNITVANKVASFPRYTYYDIPVSAGTGEPLDVSTAAMVELNSDPPRGTSYILRISGDSMEPKYCNGDYIYVKQTDSIEYGDIGIFIYQGSVYMKEYTSNGLKSLNPKYELINANDSIQCLGKVLGVVDGDVKVIK